MILNLREAESFVRCEPIVAAPSMKSAAPDLTFFTHLTYIFIPSPILILEKNILSWLIVALIQFSSLKKLVEKI